MPEITITKGIICWLTRARLAAAVNIYYTCNTLSTSAPSIHYVSRGNGTIGVYWLTGHPFVRHYNHWSCSMRSVDVFWDVMTSRPHVAIAIPEQWCCCGVHVVGWSWNHQPFSHCPLPSFTVKASDTAEWLWPYMSWDGGVVWWKATHSTKGNCRSPGLSCINGGMHVNWWGGKRFLQPTTNHFVHFCCVLPYFFLNHVLEYSYGGNIFLRIIKEECGELFIFGQNVCITVGEGLLWSLKDRAECKRETNRLD